MASTTFTFADLEAYQLLYSSSTRHSAHNVIEAGNRVIALAEQIKAQRAVMAMQIRDTGQFSAEEQESG